MPHDFASIDNVVKFLADVLEAYTVALFFHNRQMGDIYCVGHCSLSKYFKSYESVPRDRSGLLGQCFEHKRVVHCEKIGEKPIHSIMPFYSEEEKLIKALCMCPLQQGDFVLYVDTKHKWNFNRKETLWIQQATKLIEDTLSRLDARAEREEYAAILQFFYETETIILNDEDEDRINFQSFIGKVVEFVGGSGGFLVSRKSGSEFFEIEAAAGNLENLKKQRELRINGGFVGCLFERKDWIFVPNLSEHQRIQYVLFPGEPLSRKGSFLGLFESAGGVDWVLGLVSEDRLHLSADILYGVRRIFRHLVRSIERIELRKSYAEVIHYDQNTGLLNPKPFQKLLQKMFQNTVTQNTSLGLVLIQWEPYLTLCTVTTPELLGRWTREIARLVKNELMPENAVAAILGENRIAVAIPDCSSHLSDNFARQCEHFLNSLGLGKRLSYPLSFYTGVAQYPQDVTHVPELWNKAYLSLVRRISEKFKNYSVDESLSLEFAIDVLTKKPRIARA